MHFPVNIQQYPLTFWLIIGSSAFNINRDMYRETPLRPPRHERLCSFFTLLIPAIRYCHGRILLNVEKNYKSGIMFAIFKVDTFCIHMVGILSASAHSHRQILIRKMLHFFPTFLLNVTLINAETELIICFSRLLYKRLGQCHFQILIRNKLGAQGIA